MNWLQLLESYGGVGLAPPPPKIIWEPKQFFDFGVPYPKNSSSDPEILSPDDSHLPSTTYEKKSKLHYNRLKRLSSVVFTMA